MSHKSFSPPSKFWVTSIFAGVAVFVLALNTAQNTSRAQVAPTVPVAARGGQAGSAPTARLGIRFIFGDRLSRETDYSGALTLSIGRVVELIPWRLSGTDAIRSTNAWALQVRRDTRHPHPARSAPRAPRPSPQAVLPKGFIAVVDAPPNANVVAQTVKGTYTFRVEDLAGGKPVRFEDDDVVIQSVAVPMRLSSDRVAGQTAEHDYPSVTESRDGSAWVVWQVYEGGGDRILSAHSSASGWSTPEALTPAGQDLFRTAIAEDGRGRIWAVWSQRQGEQWDLVARERDNGTWRAARKLTNGNGPNFFHRLVKDRAGNLHLVWVAHLNTESHVMWSKLTGDAWSTPVDVSGANAWMPDAAADRQGNLYVAWDSYRTGNYDIFVRRIDMEGRLGDLQQVTKSPRFQAHASLAVDRADRVWVAWDETGANWGKDWNRDDMTHGTPLYTDRRPRVAVLENGTWEEPAADIMSAFPLRYNRFVETPTLTSDELGRIWARVQIRDYAPSQRPDGWSSGAQWEESITAYEGDHWRPAVLLPRSSTRPDGAFSIIPSTAGFWAVWTDDNRVSYASGERPNPPQPLGGGLAGALRRHDIEFARFDDKLAFTQPLFQPFIDVPAGRGGAAAGARAGGAAPGAGAAGARESGAPAPGAAAAGARGGVPGGRAQGGGALAAAPPSPNDQAIAEVQRARAYRIPAAGGGQLQILRGDFHRHTEISGDGAGDGSLEDYFRYMIDAARMDIGIVSDHDEGGQEYLWWRTEKAADLFHVPGGYTPLFGYERSVAYPNGHRNVVFDHRGVKILPITQDENAGRANSGPIIYPWLRQNRGVAFSHSTATGQGTDWRDNDPELEPLMEIYQGYHANYEYAGAPRAETDDYINSVHGGYRPLGMYWNALAKGYKLGVESSSDHISTHSSYAMIYSPSSTRQDIVDSMHKRHAYGATDNIVLDVRARDAQGREWMMGDILQTTASPVFHVNIEGTAPIQQIDLIKDGKFVYRAEPHNANVQFDYVDNAAGTPSSAAAPGESWYYVRVIQADRNLAWSSPIWVKYGSK
jgi:hypothetical protein